MFREFGMCSWFVPGRHCFLRKLLTPAIRPGGETGAEQRDREQYGRSRCHGVSNVLQVLHVLPPDNVTIARHALCATGIHLSVIWRAGLAAG